jgi:hypothetical protein
MIRRAMGLLVILTLGILGQPRPAGTPRAARPPRRRGLPHGGARAGVVWTYSSAWDGVGPSEVPWGEGPGKGGWERPGAVRVVGDRPGLRAAAAADHRGDEARHAVVRHAHRREPPDRFPLAAGRNVGVLSSREARRTGASGTPTAVWASSWCSSSSARPSASSFPAMCRGSRAACAARSCGSGAWVTGGTLTVTGRRCTSRASRAGPGGG